MTIKYVQYICQECNKTCLPMDMHNEEICKVCWLKEYKKKGPRHLTKYGKTKLLSG